MAESISYIKVGNQDHPIDAVTVNGLSFTSEDKTRWNNKQDALTFDSIPTENSDNLVKSGPLYTVLTDTELVVATALNDLNDRILSVDSSISEVYEEIDRALTAVLTYRGTVGTGGTVTSLPSSHEVGDVYVVSTAGTYAGQACEVGDYIICKTSGTSASNGDWNVVNGENQVSNSSASLAAPGSSVTIATVDGTNITISTPASWTGVSKNGTLTGVKFNGTSASISNGVASISVSIPSEVTEASVSGWGFTKNSGTLTGVTFNGVSASVSNGIVSLSLTFDSIPTENSDNLVKSGDLYTVIVDNEEVTAAALNDLNDRMINVENGMVNFSEQDPIFSNSAAASISSANISSWNAKQDALTFDSIPTENSNNLVKSGDLYTVITQNEFVAAAALNDLNDRLNEANTSISSLESSISAMNSVLVFDSIPTENSDNLVNSGDLYDIIVSNERVVATAFNDVNDRLMVLENTFSGAITGITVNGSSVAVSDGIANISISGGSGGGITGVTFNGTAASISDGIASISVSIPAAVTEATVSGWGFTKNAGTLTTHASHKLTTTNGTATAVNQGTEITFIESLTGTTTATSGDLTVTATRKKVTIPTAVTEAIVSGWGFTKNTGTLTSESDPVFVASPAYGITAADISNWNSKTSNTGTLTGVKFNNTNATVSNGVASITATIPTVNNSTITIQKNGTTVDSFTTNASSNKSINITVSELPEVTSSDVQSGIYGTSGKILVATYDSTNGYHWEKTGNVTLYNNGYLAAPGSVGTTYIDTGGVYRNDRSSWNWIMTGTTSGSLRNLQSDLDAIRQLPAVTSSENGQVLQVVNGEWTLVTPVSIYSGSSNPNNSQGTNGDLYLQTS